MISELKSAIGQTLSRANYIAAGTLGVANIDASTKLDPITAENLSAINRTCHGLSRGQAVGFDYHQEALRTFKEAESIRDRYLKDCEESHHAKPDPDVVAHNEREVANARAAVDAAHTALTAATTISAGSRTALSSAVKHLNDRTRAGKAIKAVKPPKVPGVPNAVVAEQRGVIAALADEQHDVDRALVPVGDAVVSIRAKISKFAEAGRPRFSVNARGSDMDLASSDYLLLAHGANGQVPIAQPDAAALVAWLLEDELADRAEAAVRERYNTDVVSLSTAQRAERLNSIAQRRLEAERLEVAAVLAAWAAGDFSVGLRADTSPVAVLSLAY